MSKKWYTVISKEYEAWDRGSTRKYEAYNLARKVMRDGETNVKIVVIIDAFCVDDFEPEL